MKIIVAPDSFKGSISSMDIIKIIKKSIRKIFPHAEVIEIPIADGGEGTVDACASILGGEIKSVNVSGPLKGMKVAANYCIKNDKVIIEMAQASGITLIRPEQRNALKASSVGTGELIRHVLYKGYRDITIGIGGSATNDGGTGAMQALGVKFYDGNNHLIKQMDGSKLENIARIDIANLEPRIQESKITVMCDVTNPLTGKHGATYVYGAQKGADKQILRRLESGMKNYESILNAIAGKNISKCSGAGAAGGIGASLMAFCGAELKSGIEIIIDMSTLKSIIIDADFIITGEGKIDHQTIMGKAVCGITSIAKENHVPVIVITGCVENNVKKIYDMGITSIISIAEKPMTLSESIENASELIGKASKRILSLIEVGLNLKPNNSSIQRTERIQ